METLIFIFVLLIFIIIVSFFLFTIINKLWGKQIGKFLRYSIFKKARKKIIIAEVLSFVSGFTSTLSRLSSDKVGGLIVVENNDNLDKYVDIGSKMTSNFFPELVYTIFDNHKSPLHDGAIIVRDRKIISVSSYLPVSKRILDVKYGARHRAAFGITEVTDAIAFVVSETTGKISCMFLDETYVLSSSPSVLAKEIIDIFIDAGAWTHDNYLTVDDLDSIAKTLS